MARSRLTARTIRNLAPVLVPLVTRVAVPMAVRSMRRGAEPLLDDARERFDKNFKKTREDLEEVRDEAVERGKKLYDQALKQGAELLEMISSKGIEAAEEWAGTLARPKRRFPWGKVLVATAVLGIGYLYLTRD